MAGTLASYSVITGGLTGFSVDKKPEVCKNGMITSFFSLYVDRLPDVPFQGAGGGPYPRPAHNKFAPGEIANFYKPVPEALQYYVIPREKEAEYFRRHKLVKLEIKMGDMKVEKEFSVPEENIKYVVKGLNIMNTTMTNINVAASNVKRLATEAVVKVKNFKLKK